METLIIKYTFRSLDEFHDHFSGNISPRAIFIRTKDPAPAGTEVNLAFFLEPEGLKAKAKGPWELLLAAGRVVLAKEQSEDDPDSESGMGIIFSRMSSATRELFSRRIYGDPGHQPPSAELTETEASGSKEKSVVFSTAEYETLLETASEASTFRLLPPFMEERWPDSLPMDKWAGLGGKTQLEITPESLEEVRLTPLIKERPALNGRSRRMRKWWAESPKFYWGGLTVILILIIIIVILGFKFLQLKTRSASVVPAPTARYAPRSVQPRALAVPPSTMLTTSITTSVIDTPATTTIATSTITIKEKPLKTTSITSSLPEPEPKSLPAQKTTNEVSGSIFAEAEPMKKGFQIQFHLGTGAMPKYKSFTLKNPNRIIIDVVSPTAKVAEKSFAVPANSTIALARVGKDAVRTRLVMDVAVETIPEFEVTATPGKITVLVH